MSLTRSHKNARCRDGSVSPWTLLEVAKNTDTTLVRKLLVGGRPLGVALAEQVILACSLGSFGERGCRFPAAARTKQV